MLKKHLTSTPAFICLILFFSLLPFGSIASEPGNQRIKRKVLLLDFQNTAKNASYDYVKKQISDNIKAELQKTDKLILIDQKTFEKLHPNLLIPKLTQAEAAELAEVAGCEAVVIGKFLTTPNRLRIQAQLVDAVTGEVLLSEKAEGEIATKVSESIDLVVKPLSTGMDETIPALESRRSPADVSAASKSRVTAYAHILGGYYFASGNSAAYFNNGFSGKASVALPLAKYLAPYASAGALLYSGKTAFNNGAFYFADAGLSVPLQLSNRFILIPYIAAGIFGGSLTSGATSANLLAPAFDAGLYATYYFTQRLGLTISGSVFYVLDKPNDLVFTVVSAGLGLRF